MRHIGLHVRLNGTVEMIINRVRTLNVDIFQCFLVVQPNGKTIPCTDEEAYAFRRFFSEQIQYAFAHCSYLVNAASSMSFSSHYAFKREWALAKRLGFTHIVLHPGSLSKNVAKSESIESLARFVNSFMRKESDIVLVLENTAQGDPTLGGDINDFRLLLEKIDKPDKLAFCIDTAHAHAYGYDIITPAGQNNFVQLIDDTIGLNRVVLLHLNDTRETCGSCFDRHEILGKGTLGKEALRSFALHERLIHIPLVMELPAIEANEECAILEEVRGWHR